MEALLTKAEDALCLLHDYATKGTSVSAEELAEVEKFVDSLGPDGVAKAKLRAKQRNALHSSAFAYVDSKGGRHLPIHDKAHVKNALARFNQTHFESAKAKAAAGRKIRAKAKELGVSVGDGDKVAKDLAELDEFLKSTGVPDFATETPTENGHVTSTGQSGLAGPVTAGIETTQPADSIGGKSPYVIPDEARVDINESHGTAKEDELIEIVDKADWLEVAAKTDHSEGPSGETNQTADIGAKASEEEEIIMQITKEDLVAAIGESVAKSTREGFAAAVQSVLDKREKAAKAERKAAKKAVKAEAKKNANNGGDVSEGDVRSIVRSEHDAEDVDAAGGGETAAITKQLAELNDRVNKALGQPVSGGPVLDGIARGSLETLEGAREQVAKSEIDQDIETLEKEVEVLKSKNGPDAAYRLSEVSQVLTLKKLQKQHYAEFGAF